MDDSKSSREWFAGSKLCMGLVKDYGWLLDVVEGFGTVHLAIKPIEKLNQVKIDNPNITMEEYIRLEEEKARRHGKVYNWETTTYGKIWDNEDAHHLGSVETEFPAIVFNDTLTSEAALSCEPTVSSLNNDEINFRISFDESDDEDCTDNDDKIDIKQPSGDMSVIPFPNVINNDVGAYAHGSNKLLETNWDLNERKEIDELVEVFTSLEVLES
ncbi:hypothetical protein Tco_1420132 [Tanacetum coccineum]